MIYFSVGTSWNKIFSSCSCPLLSKMKKFVGLLLLMLGIISTGYSQVDTSYIYNTAMPYGTLDLRIAKSPTRYYYLQEDTTFSFRESSPGVKTYTYKDVTSWNSAPYKQGNLRERNGAQDLFTLNYRILFPQNFNPNYDPGYPLILMLHGAGESGNCWDDNCKWATPSWNPNTNNPAAPTDVNSELLNNDRNLFHGGSVHLSAVNLAGSKLPNDPTLASRAFSGIVVFPQALNGWTIPSRVEDAIRLVRLLMKKYNVDPNRVYIHGLSNGGGGVYQAIKRAPWLFAAALPMSGINDGGIVNDNMTGEVAKLPLWVFQGGQDVNPTPGKTFSLVKKLRDAGGVVRYYLYPDLGHGTWNTAYNEPDFFTWILGQRKYNPHISYGNPVICLTTGAGVKMSFTNGFFAYQWQRDGVILTGENQSTYTANTPGSYRGRFSRVPNPTEADWTQWSDPVVVQEENPAKPSIDATGTTHLRGPGQPNANPYNTVVLNSSVEADLYDWYKNGSLINFSGTDIDDTLHTVTFTTASTSSNGAYTLVIKKSYCPSPPSDPVYLFFNNSAPQNITLNAASVALNGIATSSTAFLTWNDVLNNETGYELWRRKAGDPNFEFVTRTKKDAVSYSDTNLEPATTYEYKFRAINNSGRSNYVPSDNLTTNFQITTSGDNTAPTAPQNLVVTNNTISSISLSWEAAQDNAGVKEYIIDYGSGVISTDSAVTSFTITGLPINTVFPITVKAKDFTGLLSQPSNQVTGTTYVTGLFYKHSTGAWSDLDDTTLTKTFIHPEFTGRVNNFTLTPRTQEDFFNFQFTGYLNIAMDGIYTFRITSDDGSRLIIDGVVVADNDGKHGNKTVTSNPVTLSAGIHTIEVQYFDNVGNQTLTVQYMGPGISNGVTFINIPDDALKTGIYTPPAAPSAPSNLTATGTGMQRITLGWQFTDDDQTDYEIYRATAAAGPFQIVARAKSLSAIDSVNMIPGTTYYYKIRTVTASGASAFTPVVNATTQPDAVAPSTPPVPTLISKTVSNVAFSWPASSDNIGIAFYEVYVNNTLMGTTKDPFYNAEINFSAPNYSFTVKAVDLSGNKSEASAALVVTNPVQAIYYSLATGNLNALSTWKQNPDGTGNSPASFSDNGQYFIIRNRTSTSLGGDWIIDGTGSRVVVPTGVTLTVGNLCTCTIEVQGNGTVNLEHSNVPAFTDISVTSTINFNVAASVPKNNYGNVKLGGSGTKTFESGTTSIAGNLTVNGGVSLKGAAANGTIVKITGNLVTSGALLETAADNGITVQFTTGVIHAIQTQGDLYFYQITSEANSTVTMNTSGAVNIHLGSSQGGGLSLANTSSLNLDNNNLLLSGNAAINSNAETGKISLSNGDIIFASAAGVNSNLYFDPVNNTVKYLEINLTGTGKALVKSALKISDRVKIKNGELGSTGFITLLNDGTNTAIVDEIENTGKITGDVIVQLYLAPNGEAYHDLSMPVQNVKVADLQQFFPITGSFTGASTVPGSTGPSMFQYNNGWVPFPPSGGSNTAVLQRGLGYATYLYAEGGIVATRADVKGNVFQGNISLPLVGGTSADNGWSLTGNPYPSFIEWNTSDWTRSGIANGIVVRDSKNIAGETIIQYNYFDTRIGGGKINPGQAFFVKAFTASPQLTITEKAKLLPEEEPAAGEVKYMIVTLKQSTKSDKTYIAFADDATDAYDAQIDTRKKFNEGMFSLSTRIAPSTDLAINYLDNTFCAKTIPLNVQDVTTGSYALTFSNLSNVSDLGQITLQDNFTGTTTPITGSDYTFQVTADSNSYGPNRFAITFTRQTLNVSGPLPSAQNTCAPHNALITISGSQQDVIYTAVSSTNENLSTPVTGTGGTITLEIPAAKLVPGNNNIQFRAEFSGCTAQMLTHIVSFSFTNQFDINAEPQASTCEGSTVTLNASGTPAGGKYQWYDNTETKIPGATNSSYTTGPITTETVYYVTGVQTNGCESAMHEIHIYPDTLQTPVVTLVNDTLVTDAGAATYQWKKDGTIISDAMNLYFVPIDPGHYTVVATLGSCTKESADFKYKVEDVVATEPHPTDQPFMVETYPVPADGRNLTVKVSTSRPDPVGIQLLSITGQLVFSNEYRPQQLSEGLQITPSSPLPAGVYILSGKQGPVSVKMKIIVKE
jgi:hypothetical protein